MATNRTGLGRFQSLWQRNLVAGATDDSAAIYLQLQNYYAEPHRHYHTLEHIDDCLQQFDSCVDLLNFADAVELAIWFHDAILVPGKRDNELLSAKLYLELSEGKQVDSTRHLVDRLIMATLHDGSSLEDSDSHYMVDIDLSSFGHDWDEFLRDSQNLRAENPQLCDADYQFNQTGFQRSLLAKPRFYQTEFFHDRLESQARENLARYFDYLSGSS